MAADAGTAVVANGVKRSDPLLLFSRILESPLENAMKFETYGNCFVCGKNNPNGLRLSFEIDKEKQTLRTTFIASPTFQGWDGIVHGGIFSTLLDEAMAKLVYELGYQAVTASLEIKFKKPAPILEPLHVYGTITEVNKRLIRAKAHVANEDGTILATGTSNFLKHTSTQPFPSRGRE